MKFLRRLLPPAAHQPDTPQPFGYKQTWLTIASAESAAVARALNLTHAQPCPWEEGIRLTLPHQLFISPPVQHWIFVVGQPLPLSDGHLRSQQIVPLLNRLSTEFGVAHYFSTHRVVEYHSWARSEDGRLIRGYAYLGERGETLWDEGAPHTESELGLALFDEQNAEASDPAYWNRTDLHFPDEESVMQMARRWCVAPSDLTANDSQPALGVRGSIGI
jgi:hypothetical protein